jgi:hypothetical protein
LLILGQKKKFEKALDSSAFLDVLTSDELESKAAFFYKGPVTVCCKISYKVSVDAHESPQIDNNVREDSDQHELYDGVIIQAEDQEFNVG